MAFSLKFVNSIKAAIICDATSNKTVKSGAPLSDEGKEALCLLADSKIEILRGSTVIAEVTSDKSDTTVIPKNGSSQPVAKPFRCSGRIAPAFRISNMDDVCYIMCEAVSGEEKA